MVIKSPAGDPRRLADIYQFGLLISPFLNQAKGGLKDFLPGLLAFLGSTSLVSSHRGYLSFLERKTKIDMYIAQLKGPTQWCIPPGFVH